MSMSVYNGRVGYNSPPVSGDMDVADNEPARQTHPPGLCPGFVVGYYPGVVTVNIRRCLHEDLPTEQAYALGLELIQKSELSRLPWVA